MKALLTFVISLVSFISFSQVSIEQYNTLLRQCQDCLPKSYNAYDAPQPVRPVASNTNHCIAKADNTEFYYSNETIYREVPYDFTLFYLKFAAVKAGTQYGGMPVNSVRLPGYFRLANYIAAQNFEAVVQVFDSYEAAIAGKAVLEAKGYCDILLIPVRYTGVNRVAIYESAGYYIQAQTY